MSGSLYFAAQLSHTHTHARMHEHISQKRRRVLLQLADPNTRRVGASVCELTPDHYQSRKNQRITSSSCGPTRKMTRRKLEPNNAPLGLSPKEALGCNEAHRSESRESCRRASITVYFMVDRLVPPSDAQFQNKQSIQC